MNAVELIEKKRDNGELEEQEIFWLIHSYTSGRIPDYQMAAWCMAVYFRGLSPAETAALTRAMAASGIRADLSSIPGIKVDKHSTGGVGDTVTLVAAPLAAAAGVPIAKMSGRSLGFTGGTADKLEAIPGYRTALPFSDFIDQVKRYGIALASQSGDLAPADKMLYALRDATGTVESLPLIASSIMSKKIASGADAVVLDVKCGRGAFMKDQQQAEHLMDVMTELGRRSKIKVISLLTDMNIPLGTAIGNSVEVDEAVEILSGSGGKRLKQLCLAVTGAMIWAGGKAGSLEEGAALAEKLIQNGRGLDKLKECIVAQSGDTSWVGEKPLTPERNTVIVRADESGYIEDLNPLILAHVVMHLGGGRLKKEDPIDLYAGLRFFKEAGDPVEKGDFLFQIYAAEGADLDGAVKEAIRAVRIGPSKLSFPLIYKVAHA